MIKTKNTTRSLAACFMLAIIVFISGCAAAKPSVKNMDVTASDSETAITIVRVRNGGTYVGLPKELYLLIDGQKVETIMENQRMKIVLPNGEHTIAAGFLAGIIKKPTETDVLYFTADSNDLLFHVYVTGNVAKPIMVQLR